MSHSPWSHLEENIQHLQVQHLSSRSQSCIHTHIFFLRNIKPVEHWIFHSFKPHLGYCSVTHLSRRDAAILRRLRIGHTRVTHKYLLAGDSQPLCDKCQCLLTVKHILLECCSLKHVRENYFTCSSLKELFENVDATTIIDKINDCCCINILK